MALAFYFVPNSPMTAEQGTNECTRRLAGGGVSRPKDRLYHVGFGTPENITVFDVWTSQAAFDAFGQTLMPILQEMGLDVGPPSVMPVHNVIVPAAPKPKAAATKKPVAKKAVAKKRPAKAKRAAASRRAAPKPKKIKGRRRAGKKR